MKLIHGQEPAKKEDGNPNNDVKSKIPMADGIIGAGRAAKATIIGLSLVAALGIAKTGCTYEPFGLENVDASQDADAGPDSGPDADGGELDGGPDADADLDAGDGGYDSGPDADGGELDGGPDADAGPVACAVADVGTYSGTINTGAPQTVGGYVFEYLGNSGVNALFTISCGGDILEASHACPGGLDTVIDDVPSGRRITIHPNSAGPAQTNSSITVGLL